MKKIISFSLAAILCSGLFAQENKTIAQPAQKKNDGKPVPAKQLSLDGRSFKITFTERPVDMKPAPAVGAAVIKNESSPQPSEQTYYSGFDPNSKVILTFTNGNLNSSVFSETGCPYRINTSGNDMIAFTAQCRLNTGVKNNTDRQAQDTKLEIDAANAGAATAMSPDPNDAVKPAPAAPVDETKQHLPPGTIRDENAKMMNTPPAANPASSNQSEEIQRQSENPIKQIRGLLATVSGVVSNNTITGTLSWTEPDGRKVSFAYTGSAASRKDVEDVHVVGMK